MTIIVIIMNLFFNKLFLTNTYLFCYKVTNIVLLLLSTDAQ